MFRQAVGKGVVVFACALVATFQLCSHQMHSLGYILTLGHQRAHTVVDHKGSTSAGAQQAIFDKEVHQLVYIAPLALLTEQGYQVLVGRIVN